MTRKSRWWVGLLLLAGCGSGIQGPTRDRGEFEPYFQRFEEYSRAHGRDTRGDAMVEIRLGKVDGQERGYCDIHFLHGRTVVIDEDFWKASGENGREAILFHELGHCLLNRDHRDGTAPVLEGSGERAHPASLMNSGGLHGWTYRDFKDYYLKELFNSR